jgi:hypothetical protein
MPSTTITATEATKAAASRPSSTAVAMWAATENEALLSPATDHQPRRRAVPAAVRRA